MMNELNWQLSCFPKFRDMESYQDGSLKRRESQIQGHHSNTEWQVLRLQDQNRLLTAEIGRQGQTIYELEQVISHDALIIFYPKPTFPIKFLFTRLVVYSHLHDCFS